MRGILLCKATKAVLLIIQVTSYQVIAFWLCHAVFVGQLDAWCLIVNMVCVTSITHHAMGGSLLQHWGTGMVVSSKILSEPLPSKHKTFVWLARPMSKTLGRRCIKVIQMFCVCWVDSLLKSCTLCCMPCSMIRDQLIYDNHPAEDATSTSLAIHVGWITSCIPWHLPSTAELMQSSHQRSVTDWCVRGRALSYQIWCDWHYVFFGGLMELTSIIISLGTIRPMITKHFSIKFP